MENALLVGLSRQMALSREFDVVANNIANVNTNGFKRRSTVFSEFLMDKASADTFRRPDRDVSFVIDRGTWLSTQQGAVEQTGAPLDVALSGSGFLAVRTAAGDERYTRNGALEIDAAGNLVTSDGHQVMGDGGPIQFAPDDSGIVISPDGAIATSAGPRGRLRVVAFDAPQALQNEGANLFSAPVGGARAPQPGEVSVAQGALERSNVKPVIEMSRMIEISRAYTSVASMIQRADEVRRTAIQRLGDTST